MTGTRRKAGALAAQVEGYRSWLAQRGYTPLTVTNMLKDLGQVGVWLAEADLEPWQLDEQRIAQFPAAQQDRGCRRVPGPRGMRPLLGYLRQAGVSPEPSPASTPLARLPDQYRLWMVAELELAPMTVLRNDNIAGLSLAQAVPAVAGWREVPVPPTMTAADITALLNSCDRSTPTGMRDLAILSLLARLGLRSIEIARLQLGDLNWRAGELVVRGKAHRQDRMPLPRTSGRPWPAT